MDLILPFRFDPGQPPPGFCCRGVARLKPGATLAQANADVARMVEAWKRVENRASLDDLQLGPAVRPLKDDVVGNVGRVLWILLGSIGILLVIACANVANLLLVRAESRGQELAVRTALGAGWGHLRALLMVESLALSLLGGLMGLGLAYGGLRILVAMAPANLPRLNEITIDPTVFAFALATSIASGVLFGLIPIARIVGSNRARSLAESVRGGSRWASAGRSQHRSQNALVVVQVALALVLLISSGLMIRTFHNLRNVQPGFTDPATVQTVRISLSAVDVPEPERVTRMQRDILDRLAAIPGVTSAAFIDSLPMEPARLNAIVAAEGKDYGPRQHPADPNDQARCRLERSRRWARRCSRGVTSRGRSSTTSGTWPWSRRVSREENGAPSKAPLGSACWSAPARPWQEVIAVVADVYHYGADRPAPRPSTGRHACRTSSLGRCCATSLNFAIRSERTGTEGFVREIRQAVAEVMPGLPVFQIRTLREVYDQSMAPPHFPWSCWASPARWRSCSASSASMACSPMP